MDFLFFTKRIRKGISIGIFSLMISVNFLFLAPPAHAQAWGAVNIFSDLMINIMEQIQKQIQGAILGTLKVAAIQALNSKVAQLIGGSTAGQALFITNWDDFLYQTPMQTTNVYMNDFYTLSTRGKYVFGNYTGVGDLASDISGNYTRYLVEQAKAGIESNGSSIREYNLDEYTPNPETMFQEGDWRSFNAFFSNPANNPYGYSLMAESAYENKLLAEQEKEKIRAISPGFVGPLDENGNTTAPAAAIEAYATEVQNLGSKMIVAAQNPAEFLSGVVTAMVNTAVTNMVQRGVGKVQANIQREIRNVDNQVAGALNQATSNLGPAANFSRSLNQRTNVNVNVKTPPPPNPQYGP